MKIRPPTDISGYATKKSSVRTVCTVVELAALRTWCPSVIVKYVKSSSFYFGILHRGPHMNSCSGPHMLNPALWGGRHLQYRVSGRKLCHGGDSVMCKQRLRFSLLTSHCAWYKWLYYYYYYYIIKIAKTWCKTVNPSSLLQSGLAPAFNNFFTKKINKLRC